MDPSDIHQVGKWRVLRLIGQGGMSWVFEVEDPNLGARRALKMLKPAAAATAGYRGFWREARILAALDDDFLVRIYDLDKDPATGNDYYVMELLSGRDLKQVLKQQGPLEPRRAIEVFVGVLQALGKLHAQSPPVIHRDIKPGNIQITDAGRPKLLDLGIAKVTRRASDETVFGDDSTVADMFKGTVLYAAPEHLAMQESGPPSDIFAMGLCLYESLEGKHPYSGIADLPDPTSTRVSYQAVFRYYTRLETMRRELDPQFERTPQELRAVIRRALQLDPRLRYANADEMRAALLAPPAVESAPAAVAPTSEAKPERVEAATPIAQAARPASAAAPERPPKSPVSPRPVVERKPTAGSPASRRPFIAAIAIGACLLTGIWFVTRGTEATLPAPAESAQSASTDSPPVRPAPLAPAAPASAPSASSSAPAQTPERASQAVSAAGAAAQAASPSTGPAPVSPAPPSAAAVVLSVEPRGPLALAPGATQQLRATTQPAGVPTVFAIQAPGGAPARTQPGPVVAFTPTQPGSYRITVSTASTDGRAATPVVLLATVGPPAAKPRNTPPALEIRPGTTIEARVGQPTRFEAHARDDGGKPRIEFSMERPNAARSLPMSLRDTRDMKVFQFTPTVPGTYKFTLWASDAQGLQSPRQVVSVVAAKADPAATAKPAPAAPDPLAGARALLAQLEAAYESRDVDKLKAVWKLDIWSSRNWRRTFEKSSEIQASLEPLGSIEVKGESGGSLRFRQRVVGKQGTQATEIIPDGSYQADLRRAGEGWQIVAVKKR